MSQDPTKTKVIELLREWCDDPPVSVDEAVKVLSELVYPSKLERDAAEFREWYDRSRWQASGHIVVAKAAWLAARGHK